MDEVGEWAASSRGVGTSTEHVRKHSRTWKTQNTLGDLDESLPAPLAPAPQRQKLQTGDSKRVNIASESQPCGRHCAGCKSPAVYNVAGTQDASCSYGTKEAGALGRPSDMQLYD